MDIQSIIKQVLSLADLVIKNPSTSVQSSGIDLSSLGQIAGSLLGGGQQQQSSGGSVLGSILGGAISSGALGGLLGGGQKQQQQEQSSAGSALGSILGSAISSGALGGLLGGGQKQQQQEQSSGGFGDLLGQLTSRAGTITNMLSGSNAANLSSDQKSNLGDVLNIVNIAKNFVK